MGDTKERIVSAGATLFRRQGYTGTGVKQIVAEAKAPFGSLYHFFPGGKEQLGEEVVRWSGALYGRLVDAVFDPAPDVVTALENAFAGAAETLVDTDYADACPIATIALEVASSNETLRQATADVFESWIAAIADRLAAAGIPADRARDLAVATLSALEGAFILCRATRSTTPLAQAGAMVVDAVRRALP
ncbi:MULTISPECIES: TetR/AcrR family transcriptional regulator [Streptomycetaceae]|uniref:Transcriptional regulator, TetR family n=1 Tax=Streptantibioticus cattleyicolor (strain ATCC 35852 / DSM 46488 / JCM 4925 / NBRC 14057 / NRRL 8057) TaxID=1003195 RepID=F8JSV7_STREN|nr:TetR/AcrR family transcriptional regulator [Streptantibioticus cattleyicolor]AEW98021.1 transcriptional regulator, TetR family [Streptantibioticus cattleyicolor NRRL 8057 = DSM 46488]MYS62418.1 TetR family transcriptional regulator [Streptomyces sp. SID5468]CCB78339.1 putative TetR family transcriptional regulator [Streptantibioticus cattleyicolor NRRL 8057 = DSM 46488]